MKLPDGNRAELGSKIEDYSLNPLHREGQHKARVFASVLGVTLDNADLLRRAVLDAAAESDNAELRGDNGYGEVFVLRFSMRTDRGSANVLTSWSVRHSEDFPRLTTCYIL